MTELNALLTHAALARIQNTGWLRATGSDRVRWLNGMVTNSIQALAPGEGCYNFLLNAQGRIQGDLTAFLHGDAILLETTQPTEILSLLDRFIIMDDVELTDISANRAGLLVAGPSAAAALAALGLPTPQPVHLASATWQDQSVQVCAPYSPVIPRFELWASPAAIEALTLALAERNVATVSPQSLDHLRMLEGTPLYGTDIRNSETARDLPQETNQARALHFNKGCYLGQEIVERIRSRGQVHKTFSGFLLSGTLPAAGTSLESDGKPVGELTSIADIEHPTAGPLQLALGYIRREALERGQPLSYPGGTATPVALPFQQA
jgi:folate-binding protein YgfZ